LSERVGGQQFPNTRPLARIQKNVDRIVRCFASGKFIANGVESVFAKSVDYLGTLYQQLVFSDASMLV